jgi:hypothetical protein
VETLNHARQQIQQILDQESGFEPNGGSAMSPNGHGCIDKRIRPLARGPSKMPLKTSIGTRDYRIGTFSKR